MVCDSYKKVERNDCPQNRAYRAGNDYGEWRKIVMDKWKRKRKFLSAFAGVLSFCLLFFGLAVNLSGCSSQKGKEPLSVSGFAFNTTYTLTLNQGGNQELLDNCVSKCNGYEEIFSRTRKDSELYQLNALEDLYLQVWQEKTGKSDIAGEWSKLSRKEWTEEKISEYEKCLQDKVKENKLPEQTFSVSSRGALLVTVSKELAELIQKGLDYSELSQGGFDITIGPVSSLWNFTSEEATVPEKEAIKQRLPYVDYRKLTLNKNVVEFAQPGMGIDLGGIAKGYIADCLKEYLAGEGVTSGMINLGGNVLCIGQKPEKEPFHIGIQQPFADRNETIAAINADDVSVVSSGIYERYIQMDGKLYHHILNPKTGYSYENNLIGVTIVSEKSVVGDGLSTTGFVLGLEDGLKLINSLDGVEAVFITKDETLHYSDGFEKMLYQEK